MIQRLHIKSLLADRTYLALVAIIVLISVAIITTAIIAVRPGELRVPVRYSRFDSKNYSLDQWYTLLYYCVFALSVVISHVLVSAKLYQIKGRSFAYGFLYIGIAILIVTLTYFLLITRVVSLTQ